MITQIGIVAGEIWQLLDNNAIMSLKEIVSNLERPEYLVLMSLGWLLREGHVLLEKEGDDFKVRLRQRKKADKAGS